MRNATTVLGISIAVSLLMLAGCGGGSGAVPVEGVVTWNGEPVPGLVVEFMPAEGKRPSQGCTDEEGHFVLNYTIHEQGAEVGMHNVSFSWVEQQEGEKPSASIQEVIKLHGPKGKPIEIEITEKTKDLVIALPKT